VIILGISMNDYKDQNLKSAILFCTLVITVIVASIIAILIQ